jgi:small subunit ribosomal protein S1
MSRGEPFQGEVPPPMDEGWWSSVFQDEGQNQVETTRRGSSMGSDRNGAAPAEDWLWARRLYEADAPIDLPVIGQNRGGLLVQAQSLRGFVPVSHLLDIAPGLGDADRAHALAGMVGRQLHLKVIEYDPERGRLVLSERAAQAAPGRRTELLEGLRPNERVRGTITNITAFGAFVDLGGIEGLIHVSELSWGRVRHPADVVGCGEVVEAVVLAVDPEQGRIALSRKLLEPDPWATAGERFHAGDLVDGTVTNVVKFGAFVGLGQGLEGLIHISELGEGSLMDPRNAVREGERVRARVVRVDAAARRIALSLRDVTESPVRAVEGTPEGEPQAEAAL